MKKAKRAIESTIRAIQRREARNRRRNKRRREFEAYQLAHLVKFDQKLVLMGK